MLWITELTINGEIQTVVGNTFVYENVQSDLEIYANFSEKIVIITASANEGGSITPSGEVEVNCGEISYLLYLQMKDIILKCLC